MSSHHYWTVWTCILGISLGHSLCGQSDEPEMLGEVIDLEPFVIHAGEIDVIDGITGEPYSAGHSVVWGFADSMKDLLLKYHQRLLLEEIRFLNEYLIEGRKFSKDLAELADSFGIKNFRLNKERWRLKERSILYRLSTKPFFRINALIVWDKDRLEQMFPTLPESKYVRDIRFNPSTEVWERRVTTRWEVSFSQFNQRGRRGKSYHILKEQGLNLDTNEGFHFVSQGLPGQVPPNAFEEVEITYPIFFSSKEPVQDQVKRMQRLFVQNLYYIYDPFSWKARRQTRFRGGFSGDLLRHFEKQGYRVTDRDWFNPVLCNLLSDVITIRYHGLPEIYRLHAYRSFQLSQNILGNGLDLLNWNEGENRVGQHSAPYRKTRLNFNSPGGARFIALDAYMRYTDKFLDTLRDNLKNSARKKVSGRSMIENTIEEVSGTPFEIYLKNAVKSQIGIIEKYRENYGSSAPE